MTFVLVACPLPAILGVVAWRKGSEIAPLYLLGWAALLAGIFLNALAILGWIPKHPITVQGLRIGSALEAMLFSFALAHQIRTMRDRMKEHSRVLEREITHRTDVERELRKSKLELEQRVEERTGALREAKDRAERANRAKGDFLAMMSHEIRTPLNSIVGFTQILLRRATKAQEDPAVVETLRTISSSGLSLSELINNILDSTKIDSGNVELSIEPVDLDELLEAVRRGCSMTPANVRREIALERDPALPAYIEGDRTKLIQILFNLTGNAVKFTPLEKEVAIAARPWENGVEFEVRDQGPGIPRDRRESIFEPFTQADGSITRRFGGTGLGLSITKKLVDLMGGKIFITDQPGGGTIFTTRLPLKATDPPAANVQAPDELHFSPENRVLVVEDNPINQMMLEDMLSDFGIQVRLAASGSEGISTASAMLAEGQPPDLILMDIHMPEMDGLEAATRMRATTGFADTPIVGLSADAFEEQRQAALDVGMNDYLTKPLTLESAAPILIRYLRPEPASSSEPAA